MSLKVKRLVRVVRRLEALEVSFVIREMLSNRLLFAKFLIDIITCNGGKHLRGTVHPVGRTAHVQETPVGRTAHVPETPLN